MAFLAGVKMAVFQFVAFIFIKEVWSPVKEKLKS